jgi:hypothetical protein
MFPSPLFAFAGFLYSRVTGAPSLFKYVIAVYFFWISLPILLGASNPVTQTIVSLIVIYVVITLKRQQG